MADRSIYLVANFEGDGTPSFRMGGTNGPRHRVFSGKKYALTYAGKYGGPDVDVVEIQFSGNNITARRVKDGN